MSIEIINIQTVETAVETDIGQVNLCFTNALVNGDRSMSSAVQVQVYGDVNDFSLQLAIPNNPVALKREITRAKEEAFTMSAGLSVIEKMRHSLFDYDYVDKYYYDGIRWSLSKLALSHSLALSCQDVRPNRFRLDRPYTLERIMPVAVRLLHEEELYGHPQQMLHEGIQDRLQRTVLLK